MLLVTFLMFAIMVLAIMAEGMYAAHNKKGGNKYDEYSEFY
jgi:hypothetical protein